MSNPSAARETGPEVREFYRDALAILGRANIPILVGGAYALERYTGICRCTKDMDVFLRRVDVDRTLAALGEAGCEPELTFPHWLAKAFRRDLFIDLIFSSGNGVAEVDDQWFIHAPHDQVLGVDVRLVPPEEMIWSKAFIMERERYDGADIAHILRAVGASLNWRRLLDRFGAHWPVLFNHIILFGFIYPSERQQVPVYVVNELLARFRAEAEDAAPSRRLCRGTLLSREQFLADLEHWGYEDARRPPDGRLTSEETALWTEAIGHSSR